MVTVLLWPVLIAAHPVEEASLRPGRLPEQLKPLNSLVGEWRGVGQLQRGSRKGAWAEKAVCEWDFAKDAPAIVLRSERGQQFSELRLIWDPHEKQLVLHQTDDDTQRTYRGPAPQTLPGRLQLMSASDPEGHSHRITLQQLSDIRMTVLLEKRSSPTGRFRRTAGIGYTRSGTRLAAGGTNQRTCIVTGGLGTIAVTHDGETFYVCCSGCRQAFEASPDSYIADFKAGRKQP